MFNIDNRLLDIHNLSIEYSTNSQKLKSVNRLSLQINPAEIVGIVGESGSGKSQVMLAIMGLLTKNALVSGSISFAHQELIGLTNARLNKIRGKKIGMIFQDPLTSLNPYLTISSQMTEILTNHMGISQKNAEIQSIQMLERVKIRDARACIKLYPHQLSGGMRQRILIAMALLCKPQLLIADEPTTALDATIQSDIIELLRELNQTMQMAIIFITHDIAVAADLCSKINVMYCGNLMEIGTTKAILHSPQHPYTQALLDSITSLNNNDHHLKIIDGESANLARLPVGCPFHPRCKKAVFPACCGLIPLQRSITHQSQCIHPLNFAQ